MRLPQRPHRKLWSYAAVFTEFYGNASTVYDFAANSKAAIAKARQQIADVIGAKKEEIYFTAGGSESDNWL